MTPWIQSTRNGFEMAEEEMNRLDAQTAQGEQSVMVQRDMKAWALDKGLWPNEPYKDIIVMHAIERGWLQEYSNGMEVVG